MLSSFYDVDELSVAIQCHLQLQNAPAVVATSGLVTSGKKAEKQPKKAPQPPKSKDVSQGDDQERPPAKEVYDRWTLRDPSTIKYGHFSATETSQLQETLASEAKSEADDEFYYITTAINYTNGPAHMGHAYEAATTDVVARFRRCSGQHKATYFLTGTDEHGQKIAQTAESQGQTPIDICDKYSTGFRVLNQRICISNDDYVRTTEPRHERTAKALWEKCAAAGDVYLDTYSGWYNVREETFVTDSDAALSDYKDPTSGQPLKQVQEESYFFRMSKYQKALLEHIEKNPNFILPQQHRNLILARLQSDELRDLSISRTTFSWGIPVPKGFDPKHVMYVWVDALSNYLTGVDGLQVNNNVEQDNTKDAAKPSIPNLNKFWPANVHIIGKDILWFHTVIWPCLLLSAGVPLPKTVFAHGFVNDKEGKKMSKSLGNVVDPHDMLDKVCTDTFRWYLCKEAPYGGELAFNEDSMREMHNADLNDTFGNLVHRSTTLCQKYCNGVIPDVPPPSNPPIQLDEIIKQYREKMNEFELQTGAKIAMAAFRDVNGYIHEEAPWLKKGDEHAVSRQVSVRACLEYTYALAHLLLPFIPQGAEAVFKKLNTAPVTLDKIKTDGQNLVVGTKIEVGDVLYPKYLSVDEEAKQKAEAEAAATSKKESFADAQKRKKEAKAKAIASARKGQEAAGGDNANQTDFSKMEIRVGKILKVWEHPEAEKLFCEQVDLGSEVSCDDDTKGQPREIASGLRAFYKLEDLQDRKVLVVCNLKAVKMLGFSSNGMVLAAKSEDGQKVELVDPPADAVVGERVFLEGFSNAAEDGEPMTASQVKKKKTWESVAKLLKTGPGGVATWDGKQILTSAGPCKAQSLEGAPIS